MESVDANVAQYIDVDAMQRREGIEADVLGAVKVLVA